MLQAKYDILSNSYSLFDGSYLNKALLQMNSYLTYIINTIIGGEAATGCDLKTGLSEVTRNSSVSRRRLWQQ